MQTEIDFFDSFSKEFDRLDTTSKDGLFDFYNQLNIFYMQYFEADITEKIERQINHIFQEVPQVVSEAESDLSFDLAEKNSAAEEKLDFEISEESLREIL